jgi:protein involved in polysaccharide export with SLBB domain
MARSMRALVAGCALLLLAACDRPVPLTETDLAALSSRPVVIQTGEKLRVNVFGEANVSGDYDVDPSGYIVVPLAGRVKAEGLTRPAMEAALTSRLRGEYLKDPKVSVDVVFHRPFYVIGEVERVGEIPYRSGANVVTALAMAGGATYRASQNRVLIKRADEVDFREYPMSALIPVYPGDVLRVPERYF